MHAHCTVKHVHGIDTFPPQDLDPSEVDLGQIYDCLDCHIDEAVMGKTGQGRRRGRRGKEEDEEKEKEEDVKDEPSE